MVFPTVLEPFPECVALGRASEVMLYGDRERRKRLRAQLHWGIRLITPSSAVPVETHTENVSSDGFYCVSTAPLAAGQVFDCIVTVPWHGDADDGPLCLRCRARVIRVNPQGPHGPFGICCQIEQYSVSVLRSGQLV